MRSSGEALTPGSWQVIPRPSARGGEPQAGDSPGACPGLSRRCRSPSLAAAVAVGGEEGEHLPSEPLSAALLSHGFAVPVHFAGLSAAFQAEDLVETSLGIIAKAFSFWQKQIQFFFSSLKKIILSAYLKDFQQI